MFHFPLVNLTFLKEGSGAGVEWYIRDEETEIGELDFVSGLQNKLGNVFI